MPSVYGVSNHTPDQLLCWLRDIQAVSLSDVSLVRIGQNITDRSIRKLKDFVIFLSSTDFKRNLSVINTTEKTCFVFDSPMSLFQFKGINPLDYGDNEDFQEWGTDLYDYFLDMDDIEPCEVVYDKTNTYLKNLIGMMEETDSLLRPLMTFIYTLPNATHQKPVKILICYALFKGASAKKIRDIADYIERTIGLPEKKKAKLLSLALSDEAKKYQEAFSKFVKATDINKLCKKYKMSPYEFRYILSVVNSSEEVNGERPDLVYNKI